MTEFLFSECITTEFFEAQRDLVRRQAGLPLQRLRKAKWVHQDKRIRSALDRLEPGEQSLVEFLIAAHNVTKGLRAHQFHVSNVEDVTEPDYPAPLSSIPEEDENGIGNLPEDVPSDAPAPARQTRSPSSPTYL